MADRQITYMQPESVYDHTESYESVPEKQKVKESLLNNKKISSPIE